MITSNLLLESDEEIRSLLMATRTIAVVGASEKSWRDSNSIAQYLIERGYDVYPVNPKYEVVLSLKCYPDLQAILAEIDIVNIFRRSDAVPEIVEQAIEIKAKAVWMQSGVIHEEAAERAMEAGLRVVMDHCIAVDHRRLV